MNHTEAVERVAEGLKSAADCARQLKKLQGNPDWDVIAKHLDDLGYKAKKMYDSRALTHDESIKLVDQYEKGLIK